MTAGFPKFVWVGISVYFTAKKYNFNHKRDKLVKKKYFNIKGNCNLLMCHDVDMIYFCNNIRFDAKFPDDTKLNEGFRNIEIL